MSNNVTIKQFEDKIKELEWKILMISSSQAPAPSNNILTTNNVFSGTNLFNNNVTIDRLQMINLYGMCNIKTLEKGDNVSFNIINGIGFQYEDGVCTNLVDGYYNISVEMDLVSVSELIHSSYTARVELVINGNIVKQLIISGGSLTTAMTFLTMYVGANSQISLVYSIDNPFNLINAQYCNISVNAVRVGNV